MLLDALLLGALIGLFQNGDPLTLCISGCGVFG